MVTGAIAGGLAASLGIALAAAIRRDVGVLIDARVWGFAAALGVAVGGVLAPLTGWLFLRHVPLGALVVRTTMATALFAGVGFALNFNPLIAAAVGFLGESAHLAIRTPRKKHRATIPPDDSPKSLEL